MYFQEIKQNPSEFVLLFALLAIGAISFFVFSFNPHAQRWVVYGTGTAYFLWSLLHHYRQGDLELSMVVEYLLVCLLAIILLSSTLL